MIDYKYPIIASRATPIESAGRTPDEDLLWEDHQWRIKKKIRFYYRWQASETLTQNLLPSREQIQEPDDFSHCISQVEDWRNRRFQEVKVWRSQRLKKSKLYEVEDWRSQRLKFGDSTRVCDSSRVSGATDVGMPFGYPRISIPGPAHYGSGQVQGLDMFTWSQRKKIPIRIRLWHL
jgi:hypothetical protein